MIAQVTAAIASHLASGGLFLVAMLALSHRLPSGFVRFCTATAAALATFAAIFLPPPLSVRLSWAVVAMASLVWFWRLRPAAASGRQTTRGGLDAAVAVGVALVAVAALVLTGPILSPSVPVWLAIGGALSASLLLGAVTVTMVLGHWYLVDTGLSIAPLADGARWFGAAVVARIAEVVAALYVGGWQLLRVGRPADLIFSTNGLFFLFRVLMGAAAPLVLSGLIWQTVRIRSTQSATGLLYVALILVLFGELVSEFLRISTGYPL